MTTRQLRAASVALLLLASCSDQGPENLRFLQLDAARSRWETARPERYAYTVQHRCDCPDSEAGPVRVEVNGGVVVARTYVAGGEVPAALSASFPSVDELFGVIADAIGADAYEVRVTYDVASGVPLDVRIDYEPLEFDDVVSFRTLELPSAVLQP